jgi:asparagine synthase (glutamine-hydrolysing)
MCGISGVLLNNNTDDKLNELIEKFFCASRKIRHRGPDRNVLISLGNPVNVTLSFERLSIMDVSTKGDQPFKAEYIDSVQNFHTVYSMCNGEIYGYHDIIKQHELIHTSESDCEVIILLYMKYGKDFIKHMCQMFNSEHAFMLIDINMSTGDYVMYISSDRFGIRPLHTGSCEEGFYFSSELQGIPTNDNIIVERFKPRTYSVITRSNGILLPIESYEYFNLKTDIIVEPDIIVPTNNDEDVPYVTDQLCFLPLQLNDKKCNNSMQFIKRSGKKLQKLIKTTYNNPHMHFGKMWKKISTSLIQAVIMRLDSDRPLGCLLSGGVDSSLVAGIASWYLKQQGKRLRTFSIGMPDGTDEYFANMVAEYIDSDHTHITVSEEDFLQAIPNIIKTIGSFDITTVRASTGQYLISKWISENTDIKVLLCGDGSDEVCGSYKYFHNAPSSEAFHNECVRLLEDIHLYDGLRADRCISHFGIEARFPFLDINFVTAYLSRPANIRMPQNGIEKWLLRSSFAQLNLIPHEVLFRSKEAFSDGVSKRERSWYTIIQEMTDALYSSEDLIQYQTLYEHLTPTTKESLHYRRLFCEYFSNNISVSKTIPYIWLPKWCGNIVDPSARVLLIYDAK